MDLDGAVSTGSGDQWWKINYISTEDKPVSVTVSNDSKILNKGWIDVLQKVTIGEVLAAATTEAKDPIIIYASDKALFEPIKPLPDSLHVSLF
jgi:hypothetical protein